MTHREVTMHPETPKKILRTRLRSDICVVCSAGGHLSEALTALSCSHFGYYLVTKSDEHVADRLHGGKIYYVEDPHTRIGGYVKNSLQSLRIITRERPRVIVSTGAGIALATCILGKIYGAKIVFIETGARVITPSRTGKLVYKFADVFYVQWESLLKYYPTAIYVGNLL